MSKFYRHFLLAATCVASLLLFSSPASGAATIIIQNGDSAGVGFNDPTPVSPVGNNPGTTLGQQRLNVFQFAANIWGAILNSNTTIVVRANWSAFGCPSGGFTLGQAGPSTAMSNFPNAPFSGTWYNVAEANALSGSDLNGGQEEIDATFNSSLGTGSCTSVANFYLGLDNNHGADIDLVGVLLHEFSHGFGFMTLTDINSGAFASGSPSIYDRFTFDDTRGKTWAQMTNAERMASTTNTGNLTWNGPQVVNDAHNVLALEAPTLKVNSPAGIAGNYLVGTASFGAPLTAGGVTAVMVQGIDPSDSNGASTTDGCSALTNGGAVSGKIAFFDRGNCNFTVKVKNAQNAGAVGVLIADNVAGSPPQGLGGSDPTITIPSVRITQADGNTIRPQLGTANATLFLNTAVLAGGDAQGRPLLYAPNPLKGGSSVSHWDASAFPDQLMEPFDSGDESHSVVPLADLTFSLLRDIGWQGNPIGDNQFFVRQHYLDFLNREPDNSGLRFWADGIYACGIDQACTDVKRINASAAFFISIEFQETGYLVYRTYKASFGNISGAPVPIRLNEFTPDTIEIGNGVVVGQGNWQAQLEANKQAYTLEFVQRSRFTSAFATSLSPAAFVDQMFTNAGVTPSATDRNTAINEFGGAGDTSNVTARSRALRDVAENSLLKSQEFNKAFVLMQYFGYLRRNPYDPPERTLDYSGFNFWLGKLNQFNGNYNDAEMVKSFLVSGEYRSRFGQ
jgi:hypothetical protein